MIFFATVVFAVLYVSAGVLFYAIIAAHPRNADVNMSVAQCARYAAMWPVCIFRKDMFTMEYGNTLGSKRVA